jgi:ferredoxin/flavodoxin---NADP+ reductase
MFKILENREIVPNIHLLEIEAPKIARKALAGQFVVIRTDEKGERIPLTISDWDINEGSLSILFSDVGTTTRKLAALPAGESILNVVGPLGIPTPIEKLGTVVCLGGCYGIGSILPIARAMKKAGNRVISVIEARSRYMVFWEDKLKKASDQVIVTTGDGSYGQKGWVIDIIRDITSKGGKIDLVTAIGCTYMMKLCSEETKPLGIKTVVHLNPIMVDGTGMCGCCRVSEGGKVKFACVDGPEFDGHLVDWDLLLSRQIAYLNDEMRSLERWECRCVKG